MAAGLLVILLPKARHEEDCLPCLVVALALRVGEGIVELEGMRRLCTGADGNASPVVDQTDIVIDDIKYNAAGVAIAQGTADGLYYVVVGHCHCCRHSSSPKV